MRAVIFANGILERPDLAAGLLRPEDYLISADGGLRHLRALSLTPHLLIGDLDSISVQDEQWLRERQVEVRRYPVDKDFTDLELALQAALQKGCKAILIIAALGGRLDQALANLALLSLPALRGVDVSLDDGLTEVRLIKHSLTIHGAAGDTVSLLPWGMAAEGVSTHDLKYPLSDETLTVGQTRGVSNVMLKDSAAVDVAAGRLLCVHLRRLDEKERNKKE
jgi:thiamine pyrophosphokinase